MDEADGAKDLTGEDFTAMAFDLGLAPAGTRRSFDGSEHYWNDRGQPWEPHKNERQALELFFQHLGAKGCTAMVVYTEPGQGCVSVTTPQGEDTYYGFVVGDPGNSLAITAMGATFATIMRLQGDIT